VNFSLDIIFISNGVLTWSLALPGPDESQWFLYFSLSTCQQGWIIQHLAVWGAWRTKSYLHSDSGLRRGLERSLRRFTGCKELIVYALHGDQTLDAGVKLEEVMLPKIMEALTVAKANVAEWTALLPRVTVPAGMKWYYNSAGELQLQVSPPEEVSSSQG
jgi:hypothetical protein